MDDEWKRSVQMSWKGTGGGTAMDREELAGRERRLEETEEGNVVSRF